MVSAVREDEDFELRSVFASRKPPLRVRSGRLGRLKPSLACTAPSSCRVRPGVRPGSSRTGALLLFFLLHLPPARAACLQGLLHVRVRLRDLPTALEYLGVHAVGVEEALAPPKLLQTLDGLRS